MKILELTDEEWHDLRALFHASDHALDRCFDAGMNHVEPLVIKHVPASYVKDIERRLRGVVDEGEYGTWDRAGLIDKIRGMA